MSSLPANEYLPAVPDSLIYLIIVPGIPAVALLCWIKWFFARRDKRSRRPFDEMLRPAGWSLQDRMENLMEDFTGCFMAAIMAGGAAWALSIAMPHGTTMFLVTGFLACSILFFKSARILLRYSNHRLGYLGEQVVGLILDRLSSDSIRIFHDLEVREPGKKPWNIDHIVLTPAGVFAIETKCRRKPRGIAPDGQQGHKVIFDGKQLMFPHPMGTDRHGLDQASNNAMWLANKLTSLNGAPIPVEPILVLPGWWIDAKGKGSVTVLNPKGLKSFLNSRSPLLSDQQQRAINAQLEERTRIDLSLPG
jgi:hypothetical protein